MKTSGGERTTFYLFMTNFKIPGSNSKYEQRYKDIRYFFCLNRINPSGSYSLRDLSLFKLDDNDETLYVNQENIQKIFNNNIIINKEIDYTILSFDIECKHDGVFPTYEVFPISYIGVEIWNFNSIRQNKYFVLINKEISNYKNGSTLFNEDYVKIYNFSDMYSYDKFINDLGYNKRFFLMNEKTMLKCFQQILLKENVDFVLTYNGHKFDVPYINGRRKVFKMDKLKTPNIFGNSELTFKDKQIKSSNSLRLENKTDIYTNGNTMYIDLFNYVRKFYDGLEGYSLDIFSKSLFNASCKFKQEGQYIKVCPLGSYKELESFYEVLKSSNYCFIDNEAFKIIDKSEVINDQNQFYKNVEEGEKSFLIFKVKENLLKRYNDIIEVCLSKDHIEIFDKNAYANYSIEKAFIHGRYCIHDTLLCRYIFNKESIYYKINAFSSVYYLPQHEALLYKASTNICGELLFNLIHEDRAFIKKSDSINPGEWIGGKIIEPKEKFISDPVLTFDFQSLYPNTMILNNISPDTLEIVVAITCLLEATILENLIKEKYKDNYSITNIYNKKTNTYTFII